MKAARAFVEHLFQQPSHHEIVRIQARLLGSLAWTGKGHATDRAVLLGFAGASPDTISRAEASKIMALAHGQKRLELKSNHVISFDPTADVVYDTATPCPKHPNTLILTASDSAGRILLQETWLSVGGGSIVLSGDESARRHPQEHVATLEPYPFRNSSELLAICRDNSLSIAAVVRANELSQRSPRVIEDHISLVRDVMFDCIERGMTTDGQLPGGLNVKRRAKSMHVQLLAGAGKTLLPHDTMDWVSLFAIAVNEENAAGGRVVTAPTNGAAGVVPAVLRYYRDFCPGASELGIETFLLTATAIATLFKLNASISGAEVGCQGEVGVASSMAAAGLTAALGASNEHTENAAEIAMEHHLGLSCDPIGGLVQIPCIERNAFGAVKAIAAASLALRGDGSHKVSLDHVIATMRQTGADMQAKYKETSLGGLAVNYPEC